MTDTEAVLSVSVKFAALMETAKLLVGSRVLMFSSD